MLTELIYEKLGMESVNVVIKVNNLDMFLDTLKKHNFEMVEDYTVILKDNAKCLLEEDKSLAINNGVLFILPVNFISKNFKSISEDDEIIEQDSYTNLTLEVEDFVKFIEG